MKELQKYLDQRNVEAAFEYLNKQLEPAEEKFQQLEALKMLYDGMKAMGRKASAELKMAVNVNVLYYLAEIGEVRSPVMIKSLIREQRFASTEDLKNLLFELKNDMLSLKDRQPAYKLQVAINRINRVIDLCLTAQYSTEQIKLQLNQLVQLHKHYETGQLLDQNAKVDSDLRSSYKKTDSLVGVLNRNELDKIRKFHHETMEDRMMGVISIGDYLTQMAQLDYDIEVTLHNHDLN